MSCCCEKLVAETGDSLGTQGKGNAHCGKLLCVRARLATHCIKESNKSDHQSKTRV
jgi:hypothetical protein